MQSLGIWGLLSKIPYLESQVSICLFTMQFYGVMMMIKGSLLLSIPIVKCFRSSFGPKFGSLRG